MGKILSLGLGGDGKDKANAPKTCPFLTPAYFEKQSDLAIPGVGQQIGVQILAVPCIKQNCAVWSEEGQRCGAVCGHQGEAE